MFYNVDTAIGRVLQTASLDSVPSLPHPCGSSVGLPLCYVPLPHLALPGSPYPQKMDYFCASAVILYSIYLCCVR